MELKGYSKLSISAKTNKRIDRIRRYLIQTEPEKYPNGVSYQAAIIWMLDKIYGSYKIP